MSLIQLAIVNTIEHQVKGIIKGLTSGKYVGFQKVEQGPKLGESLLSWDLQCSIVARDGIFNIISLITFDSVTVSYG